MRAVSTLDGRKVEELVRLHQGHLRGFLVFLGCPSSHLDDLVQDVFLSLFSVRFEDRGPAATRGFLRRIAHHLLLRAMRREQREVLLEDPSAAEAAWVEYEADDGGGSYLAALQECLQRITGRARQVLQLRYASARRRSAIAEELGLTEAGVKSILVRARRRLRACVEARLGI